MNNHSYDEPILYSFWYSIAGACWTNARSGGHWWVIGSQIWPLYKIILLCRSVELHRASMCPLFCLPSLANRFTMIIHISLWFSYIFNALDHYHLYLASTSSLAFGLLKVVSTQQKANKKGPFVATAIVDRICCGRSENPRSALISSIRISH